MNFTSASDFTGRSRWVYQELRDRKVALFIDHLPEGIWQLSYELLVNGNSVATKQVSAADALSAPSKFAVSREFLRDGANEITIRRTSGSGPLYFSAAAQFFSLEEPIAPAGNEIFVRRQYFKLVNHPTLLKGFVSERVPLNDGETVKSGERVETVITIEAKNNYEYLIFDEERDFAVAQFLIDPTRASGEVARGGKVH